MNRWDYILLKLEKSFKNIKSKLFISLLIMGLCPAIYKPLRVFLKGQLPEDTTVEEI